jgi:hypothetical protein
MIGIDCTVNLYLMARVSVTRLFSNLMNSRMSALTECKKVADGFDDEKVSFNEPSIPARSCGEERVEKARRGWRGGLRNAVGKSVERNTSVTQPPRDECETTR